MERPSRRIESKTGRTIVASLLAGVTSAEDRHDR